MSSNTIRGAAAAVFTLIALVTAAAFAAWPNDPTVNVPVCTQAAGQSRPTLCSDAHGGAIILWQDPRNVGFDIDLYIQRIDSNGIAKWTPNGFGVLSAPSNQVDPTLVEDGSGGAIFVWREFATGAGSVNDLKAQRMGSNGFSQWGPFSGVVISNLGKTSPRPVLTSDGAGGAIVAWADYRAGTGQEDIYAQRLDANGNTLWTQYGVPVCTAAQQQTLPRIVEDSFGGAIIVWQDSRAVGTSDIYAQRINASGTVLWAANGVPVCTAALVQLNPEITRDGNGGAVMVWEDDRVANTQSIYAQRLDRNGSALWTPNGVMLSSPAAIDFEPRLLSDGTGGAFVGWTRDSDGLGVDYDIYAQHVGAAGTPQWSAGGLPVCVAPFHEERCSLVTDGVGGAIIVWVDGRTDSQDIDLNIYAQRVSSSGTFLWQANGVPVTRAPGQQHFIIADYPIATSDGAGGAILTWYDLRSGNGDIYTQRIDRFGYLAAEPKIAKVKDVRNDQGGYVKLSWNASPIEGDPSNVVTYYNIFRSVPPNVAAKAFAGGAPRHESFADGGADGITVAPVAGAGYYWEFVSRQDAFSLPGYSYVAATTGDSVAGSNPYTAFLVQARNATGTQFWNSAPDSGYSVDNVGPSLLLIISTVYSGGATTMRWLPSPEPDFAEYRVYRGLSPSFPVSPLTFVAATPDTGFVDAIGQPYYYKLTATDVHGNESPAALAQSAATVDVSEAMSRGPWLGPASPNPTGSTCRMAFGLPRSGPVSFAIYDAAGRRIRQLANERLSAGLRTLEWDGLDDSGHPAPSAIYYYRLTAAGREMTGRVLMLR